MKKIILAVDDANSILIIIKSLFEYRYEIICKSTATDALNWLQEGNHASIIITDIVMPEMDGWEFIRQLKSSGFYKNIPIIVLSGNEKTTDKIKYLQEGADDVLVKPFNPVELQLRVENIMKRFEPHT